MAKQGIELLAAHLCMDSADVKEYEYHSGHFTQKVFSINNTFYCPYKSKPTHRFEGFDKQFWVKINNIAAPYKDSVIWVYTNTEE